MKSFFTICSSLLLTVFFTNITVADEHFPFLAQVSRESVNVRAGPSTNFEKIDQLKKGDTVVVLGHFYEWYKIQPLPGTLSYIRSDYLQLKAGTHFAQVSGHRVNVRAAASSESTSLGQLEQGTWVEVLEQANGWSRLVPPAGTIGWVHHDFLKFQSASVPNALLLKPLTSPYGVVSLPLIPKAQPDNPVLFLRGVVEPLNESANDQIHYKLVVKGKPEYYLLDMSQMSFFSHMVVDVVGSVVANSKQGLDRPVLRINKISLVL